MPCNLYPHVCRADSFRKPARHLPWNTLVDNFSSPADYLYFSAISNDFPFSVSLILLLYFFFRIAFRAILHLKIPCKSIKIRDLTWQIYVFHNYLFFAIYIFIIIDFIVYSSLFIFLLLSILLFVFRYLYFYYYLFYYLCFSRL